MLLWFAYVLAAAVVVVLLEYVYTYVMFVRSGIPFRMGVPLLHSAPFMLRNVDRVFDMTAATLAAQGDGPRLFALKRAFMQPPIIFSANVDVNKYILSTAFDHYNKGGMSQRVLEPLLGQGIFNVDGALWLQQRKMAAHMFSKKEVVAMMATFEGHWSALDALLVRGTRVDVQDVMSRFTLDCFCSIALGMEIDSLRDEASPFSVAFNGALKATTKRFFFYPYSMMFPSLFSFEADLQTHVNTLDSLIFGAIEARRRDAELDARSDLLSRYILLQRAQQAAGGPAGDELTINDRYIRDVLLNFILAGRDTTAQTLTWALYFLSLPENASVEAQILDEIAGLRGALTFESVSTLGYTERFVYEVLRLAPPVPNDPKTATKDDVLPGGYRIKQGWLVGWNQNAMGRMPQYFDSPLEVRPNRWLGPEHNGGLPVEVWKGAFIPFQNGGRRVCMGQQMALFEVKSALAMIVPRYRFECDPSHAVIRFPNITLCAKNGIMLTPKKR